MAFFVQRINSARLFFTFSNTDMFFIHFDNYCSVSIISFHYGTDVVGFYSPFIL